MLIRFTRVPWFTIGFLTLVSHVDIIWCKSLLIQKIIAESNETFSPLDNHDNLAQVNCPECIKVQFPESGITQLKPCRICPIGFGPLVRCGSTVQSKRFDRLRNICKRCQRGTYSSRRSTSKCQRCSQCGIGDSVLKNCTSWYDTVCQSCPKDFYFEKQHSACLRCSRCCGDNKDIKVSDCVRQGSQRDCSYHSHLRCHGEGRNETNQKEVEFEERVIERVTVSSAVFTTVDKTTDPSNLFTGKAHRRTIPLAEYYKARTWIITAMCLAIMVAVMLPVTISLRFFLVKRRWSGKRNTSPSFSSVSCFPVRITRANRSPSQVSKANQSDEFQDRAMLDIKDSCYSFNCGVNLRYDTSSKSDASKDLIVEVQDDPQYSSVLESLEAEKYLISLSPIFTFLSQGTEFEKPVEVCLPHSALIKPSCPKTWDIVVVCVDGREGKKGKWKKVQSDINVNWNEVTFKTTTLLSYAVVGKPLELAKKRMQLVVFGMKRMVSDRFHLVLYLFDDSESSLERISNANHSKGWAMIGSLYVAFVDCHHPVNMSVQVEGLNEPWTLVHLKAENTSANMLKDSYFKTPQFEGVFRRSKRNATKFSCNLRVDIGGKEKIVPVLTFVPEERICVFVEVHNEDPTIFDSRKPVTDIPYDVVYEMCRKLDFPAKGLGQWRELGHLFGLKEELILSCSREYASIDGSPSMALMEIIRDEKPQLTVGELARCLKELNRCDALSALKNLKKYDI